MARLRRRRTDTGDLGPFPPGWDVPSQFNFTRDVVDAYAQDSTRQALAFVDHEGIVDRLSFAEVSADASRWAHLLRTRLDRGDRVVVMLGKTPSWHCAMLGALKGGLVAVPCPDLLRAADLAYRVRHSGARLVLADRSNEAEVEEMRNQVGGSVLVLYLDEAKRELPRYLPVAPTEDTRSSESALILYTSGTTKEPRGVVHTHAYTWAQRMQAGQWLDVTESDVVWCTASTGWAKAVWNVLLGPWSYGAEIVLHEAGFDPAERLGLLAKLGVTILCQAPTEYRFLAKSDALEAAYLPKLRHAVSAGEPLNPEVIARFEETLGLTIHDGYGQTENTLLVANLPGTEIRPGSMGLPTPGHDVAVIDEAGHVCPPGVEGDIALIGRPPTLFTGYWEAPEDTDAAFRDGWYVTGDRAVRDEEGYLWFVGRADDVILSSAYRIGPFEVESALLEHPAVKESAVVGIPDEDRGQIVKAFVVLREEYAPDPVLVSDLQAHVKAVTAPYKYPRAVAFVDELPKTTSGKIRRAELRANPDVGTVLAPDAAAEPAAAALEPDVDDATVAGGRGADATRRALEAVRHAEAEAARRQKAAAAEAEQARAATASAAEAARVMDEARVAEAARVEEERRTAEAARAAEEALARAEAEEQARRDAEEARARAEAEEQARRDAEEARARAEAEEQARLQAEEAERARLAAEEAAQREAEQARLQAEAEEAARLEAEEAARLEAEEAARREAEEAARLEAEAVGRQEAEAAAALQAAAIEATRRTDEPVVEAAGVDAADDVAGDEQSAGWRESRRRRRDEAAQQKAAAEAARRAEKEQAEALRRAEADAKVEAKQRAKQEAEQRKRDEEDAKRRAKDEAEQRKRDEADAKRKAEEAAKRRAHEEAEQKKLDAIAAKENARRREADAKEAQRLRAEDEQRRRDEERAAERERAEEERRREKELSRARRGGRGRLFGREEEVPELLEKDGVEETIPDLLERLSRYSNLQPTAADEPESEVGARNELDVERPTQR